MDTYLLFEGEYLNGKKHGEGKCYLIIKAVDLSYLGLEYKNINLQDKKILISEGEYLYGKEWNIRHYFEDGKLLYEMKNGKGIVKDYYNERKRTIKFEKEFLNGEANGKGKEYEENGNLKFEGEYFDNHKIRGKEYLNGKLEFEGDLFDNHRIKGKEYLNGILEFEGDYLFDEKFNGKGYDENGNIKYELINGNGKVIMYYKDSLRFEGELLKGRKNGKGKLYKKDILILDSDYKDGEPNGKTKLYDLKGNLLYDGDFKDGLKDGMGKEYRGGQLIYEGGFKVALWSGMGKNYVNGKLIFEGEYLGGLKNGKGKEYDEEGRVLFEGEFLKGKRWNGTGKVYRVLAKDKLKFILEYANGKIINKITVPLPKKE